MIPHQGANRVAEHDPDQMMDRFELLCRQRGGRMTAKRRAVLGKLLAEKRPLSAYELLDMLRPDDPSATPMSVYRSLDFLVEHGLVHRLETTKSFMACAHPDHAHAAPFLICRQCGTVVEAEDDRVAAAAESLSDRLGFALDHRTIELTGTCQSCKETAVGGKKAGAF
jgi:Fur family zinc uptake transcriptional regulator